MTKRVHIHDVSGAAKGVREIPEEFCQAAMHKSQAEMLDGLRASVRSLKEQDEQQLRERHIAFKSTISEDGFRRTTLVGIWSILEDRVVSTNTFQSIIRNLMDKLPGLRTLVKVKESEFFNDLMNHKAGYESKLRWD